jgi:hypothetical protein
MTEHTPGPWTVVPCSYGGMLLQRGEKELRNRHPQGSLQIVPEADAQLMAASPDLLEALKHAVAIIRKYVPADALGMNSQGGGDGWNDQSWPVLDEYLHYMDAAISKAEGRAP